MKLSIPKQAASIIETLTAHGYEAYVVGGCVRDSILGKTPSDWDITTSARPEQVKALFARTIDTGIKHGTVTVMMDKVGYEVTTYRIDGDYEDHRRPNDVTFTTSLKEDLMRRDFTINAMAYNDADGLIDLFGGMDDLERGIVRCVGAAKDRFDEDALRMLRAVRFAGQLHFRIEEDTREAIRLCHENLRDVSAERIQMELLKLLISDHPETFREAYSTGLTSVFFPEFDRMMETEQETPHHMYNVGEHTLHAMKNIRSDKVLRLTMLLHDMGKPALKTMDSAGRAHFKKHAAESEVLARQILRRLKFDNDTIYKVCRLVHFHDYRMEATQRNVRRAMNRIGEELFPAYLEVRRADVLAQSMYKREEKIQNLDEIEALYQKIKEEEQCVSLRTLAVSGKDLLEAGMTPGREIGEKLEELLELVLESPELNTKEELLKHL